MARVNKNPRQSKNMKVTPYEVEGQVDYDRLIKIFGVSKITPLLLKKIKNKPLLLRRGYFYAHRDFDKILKEKKFAVVSGRGASEKMTLGHLAIFKFIKELQDTYGCHVFIPFSEDEKFMYKRGLDFDKAQKYAMDNALDLAAIGFDPKKTEFFMDTFNMNSDMYNLAIQCAKKMTFSMIKDSLGFKDSKNVGSIFFPAMQAAHILYPTYKYGLPVVVVIGIDQDVMVRLSRDAAFKLGLRKPADLLSKFLPALDGSAKMSASKPESALYTTDKGPEIERKIKKAFSGGRGTLEEHRRLGGDPDIDASFQYLRLFFVENDAELNRIHGQYKAGEMSTTELKKITIKHAKKFLAEHQRKRERARKLLPKYIKC